MVDERESTMLAGLLIRGLRINEIGGNDRREATHKIFIPFIPRKEKVVGIGIHHSNIMSYYKNLLILLK